MIVKLPRNLYLENVIQVVNETISLERLPKDSAIDFDFTNLNFIEPAGLTALSNIIEFLTKNKVRINFNVDRSRAYYPQSVIRYLDDANFFQKYTGSKLNQASSLRKTTLALETIKIEDSFQWIEQNLLLWIRIQIGLGAYANLETMKLCMMEIFNNISDHSFENIACLYAQHFPRWNQIKIAISDFGIGIPTNIRKEIHCDLDSFALRKSVEEGFSTKSIPTNRGAGLDILRKNVVVNNEGSMTILSNKGKLEISKDISLHNSSKFIESNNFLSEYPGTLIHLIINTDRYLGDEEEEDFTW
jgi:anti-sigma regulatory factor (Ser/Thr protein kinase)